MRRLGVKVEKDYEELLGLLDRNKVRYCVVGAYAVAYYSRPRYTKDLDILVDPTEENSKKLIKALSDFGFGSLKLSDADFTKKGNVIQLGYEPVRVDILTSIKGISFSRVWKSKRAGRYGRHKVFFIGREELVENKKLTGRKQDKADVDMLVSARPKGKG